MAYLFFLLFVQGSVFLNHENQAASFSLHFFNKPNKIFPQTLAIDKL